MLPKPPYKQSEETQIKMERSEKITNIVFIFSFVAAAIVIPFHYIFIQ